MFSIVIEPFSDTLAAAYQHLLPHQADAVARGKLQWKFAASPGGTGQIAVARADDGSIVGMNAFQAIPFILRDGTAVPGFQSMDTIVAEAARGSGLFTKMVALFQQQLGERLLYGFPNDKSSGGFFGKLGWNHLGPVPMLAKPLRTSAISDRLKPGLPSFALPRLGSRGAEAHVARSAGDLPFDAIWSRFRMSHAVGIALDRSAAFIDWRIFAHPVIDYIVLGDEAAYVVGQVSIKHGTTVGYVMEAIGDERRVAQLLRQLSDHFVAAGCSIAFAWNAAHAPNHRAHRNAGYYPFPARLRPIEINFGFRPWPKMPSDLVTPDAWYISYLDSDTV